MAPHLAELNPLAGFSFDDCVPIHANSVEYTVQFKNGATLESLRGNQVRLLFEMVDADLIRLPSSLDRAVAKVSRRSKSEYRMPKSERNPNAKIRKTGDSRLFRTSDFFDIRHSIFRNFGRN